MVEPHDDNGHIVTGVFAVSTHGLCTAHVQNLFTQLTQHQFVPVRYERKEIEFGSICHIASTDTADTAKAKKLLHHLSHILETSGTTH